VGVGRAAVTVVGIRVLGAVAQLLVLGAYTQWFTLAEIGRFAVALAIWAFARQVGPLGGDQALLRGVAALRSTGRIGTTAALGRQAERRVVAATGYPALALVVILFAVGRGGSAVALLIVGGIPLYGLQGIYTAELRGHERHALAQIPESLMLPLLQLFIAWLLRGHAADAAVGGTLAAAAVVVLVLKVVTRAIRQQESGGVLDSNESSEFLTVSRPAAVAQAATAAAVKVPVLLVASLAGPEQAAIFEVASRGLVAIVMVTSSLGLVLSPQMAASFRDGDTPNIANLWAFGSLAAGIPAMLGVLLGITVGQPLLALFGSAYQTAWFALIVMLCAGAVNAFLGFSSNVMLMANAQWAVARAGAVQLLAVLVVGIVLIPAYGAGGAALAWLAATITRDVWLTSRVTKTLGVSLTSAQITLFGRRI
jgi:O-antigen/teichoic acid export membrane protein